LLEYYGNGYALEASNAYLENLFVKKDILKVAAISKNDNKPSLKLLEKLGFEFSREIKYEKELIQVFILSKNKFLAPQPFASWSLDGSDDWQAPVAYPDAGLSDYVVSWDEDNTRWAGTKISDDSKHRWNADTKAWVAL